MGVHPVTGPRTMEWNQILGVAGFLKRLVTKSILLCQVWQAVASIILSIIKSAQKHQGDDFLSAYNSFLGPCIS